MTVTLIVLGLAVVMMFIERLRPGRAFPTVRAWWARAIAVNVAQVGIVFLAGATWDGWLVRHAPWSAARLGTVGGAVLGYFVTTFVYYWWHRARHGSDFLWRWFHQFHHSPQRIEIITSFYKHPFELLANGILSSLIVYWLVGLDVKAATLAVTLSGIAELFYHWNVRTPYWVGFVIQRPESHLVHHQQGLHAFNYGDLPLWDMLFGTFRNPRAWDAKCGFSGDRELRLGELLLGRDVNA
jgi:sterol desaturase/sphingolipid hydroxylase (fatty acid hydroxylase superfamily)